jgi:hypothetical protein
MDTDRELDFHEQVAKLAYVLWQERGCPDGSPEDDWYRAEEQLQNQTAEKKPARSTDELLATVARGGRRAAGSA